MTTNLFVYGTLLYPELVYALTGKQFRTVDAILEDHQRLSIKHRSYPAVIPSKGARVNGKIIKDVDEASLAKIDFYEDKEYLRKHINIQNQPVQVYIYDGKIAKLKDNDWDADSFYRNHFNFYLKKIIPKVLESFEKRNI